jgi:hypothetical protein
MRCTSMSHPANAYPESGLIFGGNLAKDKPRGPLLCWVACCIAAISRTQELPHSLYEMMQID